MSNLLAPTTCFKSWTNESATTSTATSLRVTEQRFVYQQTDRQTNRQKDGTKVCFIKRQTNRWIDRQTDK